MLGSPDGDPRERVVMEERWEMLHRRHRRLVVGFRLLALAVAVGSWYSYLWLHRHEVALTTIVGAMSDQVKTTAEMVVNWADNQQSLRDQIATLGQKMETRIATVANQAQVFSSEMYRQIQAEIDDRLKPVDTRLTHIESSNENQQTRIEELQRELGEVRSQAPRQADDLAGVRSKMEESGARREPKFAGPPQSEKADRRDVDALGYKLAVHRIDFEVTKNHSRQLADGISLGITSTDTLHRCASGWMWVMPDRRSIWLKAQNAGEAVVFYGKDNGKKRELVITNVTEGSITGYLLLAGESGAGREMASGRSNK